MTIVRLDICVLADLRAGDVAAPCHAAALRALADAGYRIGVLGVVSEGIAADPYRLAPDHAALFAGGQVTRLAPGVEVDCTLALAFDARIFAHRLPWRSRISSLHRIVTVERPAALARLSRADLERLAQRAATALGGEPIWAPTTLIARDALSHAVPDWPLAPDDWHPAAPVEPVPPAGDRGRARPAVGMARIARSRPGTWPVATAEPARAFDTLVVCWRMRAGPDAPRPLWPLPAPVELWPDDRLPLSDFLARIDLLANPDEAADDPCPVEVLLALAAGVVPFLPPEYRPVFGGAALFGRPPDLPRTAVDFHGDSGLAADLRAAGRDLLAVSFPAEGFVSRVRGLIGGPRADPFAPAIHAEPRTRVLFYSTNGVGMGHLTRQIAIARRLPGRIEPVFLSHSQAVDVVRAFGFAAEHLPYHAAYGEARVHWNAALAETLGTMIGFYRPSALVFDGNVPFVGLLTALERAPQVARIWVRRGLWGPNRDPEALERGRLFDLIVEPGEVAAALDDGPTANRQSEVLPVPPIRLLEARELPDRASACEALGLDPAAVNVLVSPGSGNNFDTGRLADMALDRLAGRKGIGVAVAEWRIARSGPTLPPGVARLANYPFAEALNAFDFAIAAAGYNTFVEHLERGLPTIWTPNEHAEQDRQILRATFAEENGLGCLVRVVEPFGLMAALDQLLDPQIRERFRQRGAAFSARAMAANGALDTAAAIASLCTSAFGRAPVEEP